MAAKRSTLERKIIRTFFEELSCSYTTSQCKYQIIIRLAETEKSLVLFICPILYSQFVIFQDDGQTVNFGA